MDKTLMHWQAWGLLGVFFARFGYLQPENDKIPPAQLARLLRTSILLGEVVAPLKLVPPIVRVNYTPEAFRRRMESEKLRRHKDGL